MPILATLQKLQKVASLFHTKFIFFLARKTYFLSVDFGGIQMQGPFQYMGVNNVPAVVVVSGKVRPELFSCKKIFRVARLLRRKSY